MPADWTQEEVDVIVAAYFEMLSKEQLGIPYKKSEVRKRILPLLNNRSEGSVELREQKHKAPFGALSCASANTR
jgi:hypothetical protein